MCCKPSVIVPAERAAAASRGLQANTPLQTHPPRVALQEQSDVSLCALVYQAHDIQLLWVLASCIILRCVQQSSQKLTELGYVCHGLQRFNKNRSREVAGWCEVQTGLLPRIVRGQGVCDRRSQHRIGEAEERVQSRSRSLDSRRLL